MVSSEHIGKVSYNIDRVQVRDGARKWDIVREVVETLPIVPKDLKNGWASIEVDTKENAGRAATAANTHAKIMQTGTKAVWRIQTAVELTETGALLYLRKIHR